MAAVHPEVGGEAGHADALLNLTIPPLRDPVQRRRLVAALQMAFGLKTATNIGNCRDCQNTGMRRDIFPGGWSNRQ
jgi:hypothetical protein